MSFIDVDVDGVAAKEPGLMSAPIKVKHTVLLRVTRVTLVIGLLVAVPSHDFADGVVASVKLLR